MTPAELGQVQERYEAYQRRHKDLAIDCRTAHSSADDVPALLTEIERLTRELDATRRAKTEKRWQIAAGEAREEADDLRVSLTVAEDVLRAEQWNFSRLTEHARALETERDQARKEAETLRARVAELEDAGAVLVKELDNFEQQHNRIVGDLEKEHAAVLEALLRPASGNYRPTPPRTARTTPTWTLFASGSTARCSPASWSALTRPGPSSR